MQTPANQSTDQAELLQRAQEQFLRSISHELRTPVSVALIWANLLREKRVPPEQIDQALAAIEQSARDQKRLVDLLGDAARISGGRVALDRRPTDVATLVRESLDLITSDAETKGVAVTASIGETGLALLDSDRFRQALGHLLSNALRHTPRGGTVMVITESREGRATVRVSDTGVGIDPQLLPHLFAPTLHAKRSELACEGGVPGGLGLGLMIAKRLIELHEGTLTAESAGRGRGAAFTLTLPIC